MIHSIEINEFRNLKNVEIKVGRYITAISGRNGLGKSTILALIGNSCELKKEKTYFNTNFRTEFSEIFKGSKEFDLSGSNKCKVNFCDKNNKNTITETKICRTTWQTKKKKNESIKRFRVIPETKTDVENNSKKMEWPSLYLGLSRLYPVGEVNDENLKIKAVNLDDEEYFKENYLKILNLDYEKTEEVCVDMIDIGKTAKKKGVGITTGNYSSITNSAGQDNIGQIILAIMSFKRLKSTNSEYKGGLLLIDEIEATLHPVAQINLLNFLYEACKELDLQVIFTTHSISLLKNLARKTGKNTNGMNDYEVYYCTKANGPLKFYRNPEFSMMESDLILAMPGSNIEKITIYSEDSEARWLLKKLIKNYDMYVNIVETKVACSVLLQLNKNDPLYFSNIIFVLDGDVQNQEIENNNNFGNIIKLPGKVRPEEVIYKFLMELKPDSQLLENGTGISFSKETLRMHGPTSSKYRGKDREKYKKWFNDMLPLFESLNVFDYWRDEHKEDADKFLESFKKAYNKIARRKLKPTI
ncbi:MAG: AAA family ATPase [Clostridium sp.]